MADTPTTSETRNWASATINVDSVLQQLKKTPENRRALEGQLAAAEEVLLDLHAPDLPGAIRKLELLWDGKLHGLDRESNQKLMILDDLRRFTAA